MADIPEILDEESDKKGVVFKTEVIEDAPSNVEKKNAIPQIEELSDNDATFNFDEVHEDTGESDKKRFITIGVIALIVCSILLFFVFRALFSKQPVKDVSITYWGLWEDESVLNDAITAYQKENKHVTITYKKVSPNQYLQRLLTQTKEGRGPDIFRFHNSWVPVLGDVLAGLPPNIMKLDEFEKAFYPIHKKDLFVDKYIRGMPLYLDGIVLAYNVESLKGLGLSSAPKEIDPFIEAAKNLTVYDNGGAIQTAGFAAGTVGNVDYYSDIFGWALALDGIKNIKDITASSSKTSLEFYRKFAEPEINTWSETMPKATTAFTQERVAMVMLPTWELLQIKKTNPKLDIKTAPVPVISSSNKPTSIATYWIEGVNSGSKPEVQLESWKFLKYLSSTKVEEQIYIAQSKVRAFGMLPSRKELSKNAASNPYLSGLIEQADDLITIPFNAKTQDVGFLNTRLNVYVENAINEAKNGTAYQDATAKLEKGIQEVYSSLKLR
jgi:multiple sugar transport system substrate-binding protein